MVYGQFSLRGSAVLAPESVPPHDVAAGQFNMLVGYTDVGHQPDNTRQGIGSRYAPEYEAGAYFYDFCLRQDQQEDCLFDRADTDRLVASVEDKDFLRQRVVR